MTLITVEEAAVILRRHPRTVQRMCRERRIGHIRDGRLILFKQEHLDEWQRANEQQAVDPAVSEAMRAENPSYRPGRPVVVSMRKRSA